MNLIALSRVRRSWGGLLAACFLCISSLYSPSAGAFEAVDGRFQAHGYFEMQLRTMNAGFNDQWDMTQWYNVFNLELEFEFVRDTHGPLDLLEAFIRIEGRYDCIYSHGCGMLNGVDLYGNDARRMPARLNDGEGHSYAGNIFISNEGPLTDAERNPYTIKNVPGFGGIYEGTPEGGGELNRRVLLACQGGSSGQGSTAFCQEDSGKYAAGGLAPRFWDVDRNRRIADENGNPVDDGTDGAPYLIAMAAFKDFRFASQPVIGGSANGHPLLLMGPWLPENYVEANASLSDLPNPLDQSRVSPQSLASGFGANPMRPIPVWREDEAGKRRIFLLQETQANSALPDLPVPEGRWETINPTTGEFSDLREASPLPNYVFDRNARSNEARGSFTPSAPLRRALADGIFSPYPFNISETRRAFNRGASQQDEGELKEAYFDIEMFDSRLWLRLGKQNIVWGKTELFRTTDQFNPQDMALSTLPNLEESRIGLWALRGVWSFYEVGPLSDVRLELAMNFDQFEPADLGSCGEPYAVNLICALTLGSWAHGMLGIGVAGFENPPDPWDDADGIEFGARLEWRWDRFSFALTDFYGYDDFPHPVRLHTYNRNVDWRSGRPRFTMFSPAEMASADRGCATPSGRGVAFVDDGTGQPDFNQAPTGSLARVSYDQSGEEGCLTPGPMSRQVRVLTALDGDVLSKGTDLLRERAAEIMGLDATQTWVDDKGTSSTTDDEVVEVVSWQIGAGRWDGSVVHRPPPGQAVQSAPIELYNTDGSLNSQLVLPAEQEDFLSEYGVPMRVDPLTRQRSHIYNSLATSAGVWLNDSARANPNDPRRYYSSPENLGMPAAGSDWPDGPQAALCASDSRLTVNGVLHPYCVAGSSAGARGRRIFDTSKFVSWDPDDAGPELARLVPNPRYNPFYDPRFDRYFDAGNFTSGGGGTIVFEYAANPGDVIAAQPVVFDPFRIFEGSKMATIGHLLWANAYDPTLAEYDTGGPDGSSRNALDVNPLNQSLFNWVCSVTVGFSDLDPSACALTVFSSSKTPAGSESAAPRISFLIGAFVSGAPLFNSFLGSTPTDSLLSKGPLLAYGMGMPLVQLHQDAGGSQLEDPAVSNQRPPIGDGLDAFRTPDIRRDWQDYANGERQSDTDAQGRSTYRWIYSREGESYNCIGGAMHRGSNQGLHLCGGLEINVTRAGQNFDVASFISSSLTPEQEALLGCGPYFRTSCDANGMDLMWAEGSVALQAFVGSDSLGIDFASLGLTGLVSGDFGSHLMDNGSLAMEYRTDGRVVGSNGRLIRIDPDSLLPVLGSDGYVTVGNLNGYDLSADPSAFVASFYNHFPDANGPVVPCSGVTGSTAGSLLKMDGSFNETELYNRASARCWDLRRYYVAYGLQPGTATFEILGLGGPKCTTADIGGPADPIAGVLPGCRKKWATIQYQPLDSWTGDRLHPNNPDAGYIGNNWYGQVFSYKASRFDPSLEPEPRRDYRQWSRNPNAHGSGDELANDTDCGTGNSAVPGDPNDPRNYDCYLRNPSVYGLSDLGQAASVRLDEKWIGNAQFANHYAAAVGSQRSGLLWGVYNPTLADCDPTLSRPETQMQNDPDCYMGGWRQTVDGDPDRLGVDDNKGAISYPQRAAAVGPFGNPTILDYGERIEGRFFSDETVSTFPTWRGCTAGSALVYLQRTADGTLLPPPECAEVFRNPSSKPDGLRWPDAWLGGAGHPFTGESFSSELVGQSFDLMMMLVTFSEEFTDGLASVRGFVHPELYESRYIYDEEWMWNPACDGTVNAPPECAGGKFVAEPGEPVDPGDPPAYCRGELNGSACDNPYPAYGNPNRDPANLEAASDRVRQVAGWRYGGIQHGSFSNGPEYVPNPIPDDVAGIFETVRVADESNRLQRDPSLPNIMTIFPDLLMRECDSARQNTDPNKTTRELYENCGTEANGGRDDWTKKPSGQYYQEMRLGNLSGEGGLLSSMQWDFAFTGTENDLMAMIPYCENLGFTQRHVEDIQNENSVVMKLFGPTRIDCSRESDEKQTLGRERCTYVTPHYCGLVQALSGVAGQKRNVLRAGGNGRFGRRTMQWQSGSEISLAYDRRNVLGFSMDFAEDYTKSNWSMEFTWIGGRPFADADSYDFNTEIDEFNLTVSVDRPTFINFLNANRTLFFNSQWFFQYRSGYRDSFSSIGPWNVLATFAVFTGYFQDRLNPTLVFVWDFRSRSGGALPQINYRFSENFSITVGASIFTGEQDLVTMPVNEIGPASTRSGPNAYMNGSDPGLALVRDRDEVFMSLRYTF